MLIFSNYSSRPLSPLSYYFSLCSALQALAAFRLISADFPTHVALPAFQIEQGTRGEISKKEHKHNWCFLYLLVPLILFPPRLWIHLVQAERLLHNFLTLLVSLPTKPSNQLGTSL